MPQTFPLGSERYIAYLKTDPLAPRQEPARTHEVRGLKRHGEGVAYRLFGSHAVVIGEWTGRPMTQDEENIYRGDFAGAENEDRSNGWGRLIRPDEMDTVAAHLWEAKMRRGWRPSVWHWRYYYDPVVEKLFPTHLLTYNTYGDVHLSLRDGAEYWGRVLKARYHHLRGHEPDSGRVEWKPFQVIEEPKLTTRNREYNDLPNPHDEETG